MKKLFWRGLVASIALVFVLGVVPAAVFAVDSEDDSNTAATTETETEDKKTRGEALKQRLQELKEERQATRQQRLDENKLKACENRKTRISAIMSRAVTRAEKQLALFDTIAGRVKAFYEAKGKVLANYDELVAAVDAAKADAQANLETLKNMEPFTCSAEDPKGDVEAFKLALKSINQDLKDYRTAVKNLIVGVKSVQSTTVKEENGGDE